MRLQRFTSEPKLHAKGQDRDYDSGPRRRRRREPVVEIDETFEHKALRKARELWNLAREHSREATAIVAGVALVVAAIVWCFMKEAEQESQAWAQLSKAVESAKREAQPAKSDSKAKAKKTEELVRPFERIIRDCGTTSATPYVQLQLGNTYYQKGDFKNARVAFAKLAREYPDTFAGKLGLLGEAYALEELHKFEEAAQRLRRLREDRPDFLKAQVEMDLARCLEAAGRTDEAKQHYSELLKMAPDESLREVARYRLDKIAMGASGPPAQPAPKQAPAPKEAPTPAEGSSGEKKDGPQPEPANQTEAVPKKAPAPEAAPTPAKEGTGEQKEDTQPQPAGSAEAAPTNDAKK